jgi:tRNA-dihydrouridine synthase
MIQWTDSHFRTLLRSIAAQPLLYTEMIMDQALVGQFLHQSSPVDPENLAVLSPWLCHTPLQQPLCYQLGGGGMSISSSCPLNTDTTDTTSSTSTDPTIANINPNSVSTLALASSLVCDFNPSLAELNINSGCPSNKAKAGGFGADLMRRSSTDHTRACISEVVKRVGHRTRVSVKCRIGCIAGDDPLDSRRTYKDLVDYVQSIVSAGCTKIIVHGRLCVLSGLSTAENRTVPPLRYGVVRNLVRDFPDVEWVVNGGINTLQDGLNLLGKGVEPAEESKRYYNNNGACDERTDTEKYGTSADWGLVDDDEYEGRAFPHGVMIGRAVYHDPCLFHSADSLFYEKRDKTRSFNDVLDEYFRYVEALPVEGHGSKNNQLNGVVKPLHNLFAQQRGNSQYKIKLDKLVQQASARKKRAAKGCVEELGDDSLESIVRAAMADTLDSSVLDVDIKETRPEAVREKRFGPRAEYGVD